MPSIGQTWVLAPIGAVVEMGILSTLKRLLMESTTQDAPPSSRRMQDTHFGRHPFSSLTNEK
jgi:hypothetical protein